MLNYSYLPHCFIDSISKLASFTWIITLKCFRNHIKKYAEEESRVRVLNVTQLNDFHNLDLFLTCFSINTKFRGLSTETKLYNVWLCGGVSLKPSCIDEANESCCLYTADPCPMLSWNTIWSYPGTITPSQTLFTWECQVLSFCPSDKSRGVEG